MFTVRGKLRDDASGPVRRVVWDGGQFSGDAAAVGVLNAEAAALDGRQVGPVGGPYTLRNHVARELSAIAVARGVFAADATVEGDTAPRPAIPEDAIG